MHSDLLVSVPVWLALAGWFVGSFARAVSYRAVSYRADNCRGVGERAESVYRLAWLFGAAMIVLHILMSYGVVYEWSHRAAVEATAEESERVTGIRAGWGVYVNFLFAAVWLGYSLAMVYDRRRWPGVDRAVFWFTTVIVVSSTVIFEGGAVRWLSVIGFVLLAILATPSRRPPNGDRAEGR